MSVTLHTTAGDIKIELYCQECPKACENFLALCASDYYKDSIFHRNIKDFMVQTGDPTGTGKGGSSIWGIPFADELNPDLKHDARGVVSMANNGPNTNKSQFFITYDKQPHLDLKYTVFGRVIDGFDALEELETIKVDAKYRPVVEQSIETLEDITLLLAEQRAKDIVVLSNLSGSYLSDLVICSPFNSRHGSAIAEALRRSTKPYNQPSKTTVRENAGWFIVNIGTMQVNVISEDLRCRYDIEGLWGAGEEEQESDISLIPPSR